MNAETFNRAKKILDLIHQKEMEMQICQNRLELLHNAAKVDVSVTVQESEDEKEDGPGWGSRANVVKFELDRLALVEYFTNARYHLSEDIRKLTDQFRAI